MEVNEISQGTKKSIKTRTITALVMLGIMGPCIVFGSWFFLLLTLFIALVAIKEFIAVMNKKYPWYVYAITYGFTLFFTYCFFSKSSAFAVDGMPICEFNELKFGWLLDFSMKGLTVPFFVLGLEIAVFFALAVIDERIDLKDVTYLITMSIFTGFAVQSCLFLRYCPAAFSSTYNEDTHFIATCLLFIFVVLGVCLNDIFAFFAGMLFGKHKMNPRISPKKTWEGFVGGVVLSTVGVTLFAIICDKVLHYPLIKGFLDAEHWFFVVLVGLAISLSAVIGDLTFSLIKRTYNVKDFGTIFPGHGGVLDRFDSLLVTALVTSGLIQCLYLFIGVVR